MVRIGLAELEKQLPTGLFRRLVAGVSAERDLAQEKHRDEGNRDKRQSRHEDAVDGRGERVADGGDDRRRELGELGRI